jgi:hypothetical protein
MKLWTILTLVAAVGCAAWLVVRRPWVRRFEMADPGAQGARIAEPGNWFPASAAAVSRHPTALLLGGSEGGLS